MKTYPKKDDYKKVRVCQLLKGDHFIMNHTEYWVSKFKDDRLYYRTLNNNNTGSMSQFSEFWVLYVPVYKIL